MNLIKWEDPFAGLTSLHSQLDDMFNNFWSSVPSATMPAMDVYTENDKQLITEINAPGFTKDDIDINVRDNILEIKGEKRDKEEDKKKRSYMMRESSASFYRRIALPKHADGDNVKAEFENGLLKVIVPFKELPKPKKIQISSGKR